VERQLLVQAHLRSGKSRSSSLLPLRTTKLTPCVRRSNTPAHELSSRQEAALEELSLFRTTLDSLRARLPNLEHFIANAQLKEEDSAELDEIVAAFGDPATDLSALREEEGGEASTSRAGPFLSRRASSFGGAATNGKGGDERQAKKARLVEPKRDEEQSGSNVEAAVSLEFYTLGRPRSTWAEAANVSGPSADEEGSVEESPNAPPSPSHRLAVLPPVANVDSPLSRFPDGRSLAAMDPGVEAETLLLEVGLDLYRFHVRSSCYFQSSPPSYPFVFFSTPSSTPRHSEINSPPSVVLEKTLSNEHRQLGSHCTSPSSPSAPNFFRGSRPLS
jgi:hypothetical protein